MLEGLLYLVFALHHLLNFAIAQEEARSYHQHEESKIPFHTFAKEEAKDCLA